MSAYELLLGSLGVQTERDVKLLKRRFLSRRNPENIQQKESEKKRTIKKRKKDHKAVGTVEREQEQEGDEESEAVVEETVAAEQEATEEAVEEADLSEEGEEGEEEEEELNEEREREAGKEREKEDLNITHTELSALDCEQLVDDDPYLLHFHSMTAPEIATGSELKREEQKVLVPGKGFFSLSLSHNCSSLPSEQSTLSKYHIKKRLQVKWRMIRNKRKKIKKEVEEDLCFDYVQKILFPFFHNYTDVFFALQSYHSPLPSSSSKDQSASSPGIGASSFVTHQSNPRIRELYLLHCMNHILKTRDLLLKNNARINANPTHEPALDIQDSGFMRCKVLILLPFRNMVYELLKTLFQLLPQAQADSISHKKRFEKEYRLEEDSIDITKPVDFQNLFQGNIDDCFRLGLSFSRKNIHLFTDFYSSDIIIASPLALRMIIGTPADKKRDYDFLSSVEILVADSCDIFLMQNWEHFEIILNALNQTPKKTHSEIDFGRLRPSALNNWMQYQRQTIVLSSVVTPEILSLFNRHSQNVRGKVLITGATVTPAISRVIPLIRQTYQKIPIDRFKPKANKSSVQESQKSSSSSSSSASNSLSWLADGRFEYFKNEIYPMLRKTLGKGVLIYIPSYFDYVRVRNFLKQKDQDEDEPGLKTLCEYTSSKKVSSVRREMVEGRVRFLLYTERFHFFRRYKIKGVNHIIFYQLPTYPHFYDEILNFVLLRPKLEKKSSRASVEEEKSCFVLYSRFDQLLLEPILGSTRTAKLLQADSNTHVFC